MRVNVLKSLSISKTFMKSGLKLLKYHYSLRKIKTKTKSKSKSISKTTTTTISNNLTLEFYLNLYTNVTETLLYLEILANLLVNFAIFANHKRILIGIFTFNVVEFIRLTVLMNVFRLKTFYNNINNSSQTFKTLNLKLNTSSINFKTKQSLSTELLTLITTASSTLHSNNCVLFKSPSSYCNSNSSNNNNSTINNHYRTYNNSKKSNKVFLNYTPRDPRLRILLKTKHYLSRPFIQCSVNNNKSKNNNRSDKILNDLCNYGELIGGGDISSAHKRVQFQRFFYSLV